VQQQRVAGRGRRLGDRQGHDDAEVKAAVAAEGTVNVGNWTYSATAEIVNQFQKYVKDTYGADIKLNYVGSQQPSEYLTKLAADQKAGNKASFDVIAVEENYWYDASQQGLVDDALNSKLIPNAALVLDAFKHAPQSIAFQSTAYPAIVYNKDKAGFLTKLMDLADPRLKGKLTMPKPTDITAGGLLLGLAAEMGKDYKDPNQMKEVVDWAVKNIGPNVVKYTTDQATPQQLFESGASTPVGFWNSLARLEYLAATRRPALLVPPTIYPANGYLWIPKNAPHPVLAQIFINWRSAKDVQFPNDWPIDHGQWSELSEGFLGPGLRRPRAGLVQGRLQHVLPDARPDQVGLQDDRLEGLQRQREGLPRLLLPAARPVGRAECKIRLARRHRRASRSIRSTEVDRGH
jgi:spermidine/putrescine-binding protein